MGWRSCLPLVAGLAWAASGLETASTKNRPVSKVITLLKEMLQQMEKEAEQDEEVYNKLACWCTTNSREKSQAIANAEGKIQDLTTEVEQLTATGARLNTEIKRLESEVASFQSALDKASALRTKQLAEFNAEEKDLLESISALKAAIVVLSKHNDASLLQMPQSHVRRVATTLRREMQKHAGLLESVIRPSERRTATSFIQAVEERSPTFRQSYTPESGEIFGILTQMKETFEANLAESRKEEAANQQAYEELKAAKEEQIAAGQSQVDTKTQELASADEKNAATKDDIHDTRKSLSVDEQFLMMLKEKCQMTDNEWQRRQETRHGEMEAVAKALAVLSADDAHDTFTRTFNPALVQKESSTHSQRRARASKLLSTVADRTHSSELATLAHSVRLDAFTKVKKAIDDMAAQLLKEKEDERKHKDFCVREEATNRLQTDKKQREKKDATAHIEDLELRVKGLTESITALKAEVMEMQTQMKRAGEDREKENKDFQTTVADQRETQRLLKAALRVLEDFYKQDAALLQGQEPGGPPPPPGFEVYKRSGASGGVMQMIQQIISDAKAMEAEAIRSEEDAQKAYEDFVKMTNAAIDTKGREVVNRSEDKAKSESDLVEGKEAQGEVVLELEQLANSDAQLHQGCDFVLRNFEARQTARDEEIQALRQARAILSGAKFDEFLQSD